MSRWMKIQMGLRTEIVVSVALLVTAVVVLTNLFLLRVVERGMLEDQIRMWGSTVDAVQRAIPREATLAWPDPKAQEELEGLVRDLRGAGGFVALSVYDHRGRLVAVSKREDLHGVFTVDTIPTVIGTGEDLIEDGRRSAGGEGLGGWLMAPDLRRMQTPLYGRGVIVGAIEAVVPLDGVRSAVFRSRRHLLIFTLFEAFIITGFLAFVLTRNVLAPLKALVSVTKRIADGDLDRRVPAGRDNEIGQLSRAFNRMSDRLAEKRGEVGSHVADLERTNTVLAETREQLVRSEKLASVGRLAAGVAHEIGNPLSSILGLSDMLLRTGRFSAEDQEQLERIQRETQRIHEVIRRLLDFSRPAKLDLLPVSVNEVCREAAELVRPQGFMRGVEIVFDLEDGLPPVRVDRSHFEQVLVNILVNSGQAMPEGGSVYVRTRAADFSRGMRGVQRRRTTDPAGQNFTGRRKDTTSATPLHATPGAGGVMVSIRDAGPGIPEEHLDRIFDPFFTTKEPGEGTGLGLAVAHRIIELFGGEIAVESSEGDGTEISILLPAVSEEGEG